MKPAPFPRVDGTQPCAEMDPEQFFPTDKNNWLDSPEAIRACQRCPFVRECLAYALTHDVHGIWGATTKAERKRVQQKNGIRPVPSLSPLSPSIEEIVALHERGVSIPDIAKELDTTSSNIHSRLYKHRKQQTDDL